MLFSGFCLFGVFSFVGAGVYQKSKVKGGTFKSPWQRWQVELLLPQPGTKFCLFLQDMFCTSVSVSLRRGLHHLLQALKRHTDLCKKATQEGWPNKAAAILLVGLRTKATCTPLFTAFLSYLPGVSSSLLGLWAGMWEEGLRTGT